MLIDLTGIIKDENGKIIISEDFVMPKVGFMGEEFDFSEPLRAEGSITNNSKSLELDMRVTGSVGVHCARCGKPVTVDVDFPVREILVREDEAVSDGEDVVRYQGQKIELDEVIVSDFLLSVPAKYLCSEDCKGLCPHCGADLNETTCNCDKDIIDPRWEKLAEIMKNMTDTE